MAPIQPAIIGSQNESTASAQHDDIEATAGLTRAQTSPVDEKELDAAVQQDAAIENGAKPITQLDIATVEGLTDQTNRLPTAKILLIYLGLGATLCITFLDQTIVATALPAITADLQGGDAAAWIATSYLITSMALTPIYGRLSDIFGRKSVLLVCLAIFELASLLCAIAQSTIQLIVFRAIQGIGGGAILTLALIVVSDVVSLKDRGKYQGIFEIIIVVSNSVGPLMGGLLSQAGDPHKFAGWRLCFWINLPLCLASIVIVWLSLPQKTVIGSVREKMKRVDYFGTVLVLAASVLLLLGLNLGGIQNPWASAAVIVPLALGVILLVAFAVYELKVPELPIIPPRLFLNRTVTAVSVLTFFNGAQFYSIIYQAPLFSVVVLGTSSTRAGILLLPFLCVIAPVVFAVGQGMARGLKAKWAITVGFLLLPVALGLLSTLDENSSQAHLIGYLVFAGSTIALTFQSSLVCAQAAVERHQMAVVTSVRNAVRLLGGSIFLALASAILTTEVQHLGFDSATTRAIINDPAAVSRSTLLSAEDRERTIAAYVRGFRTIYLILAAGAVVSFIASLCIEQKSLRRAEDAALKQQGRAWLAARKAAKKAESS